MTNGPIDAPPSSGWKIVTLPAQGLHLQAAWNAHPETPTNARAAWNDMMTFLAANGVRSADVTQAVLDAGIEQWCGPDPSKCPKKFRKNFPKVKPGAPDLPWAKDAWEMANNALNDDLADNAAKHVLNAVIKSLTGLISGKNGCPICHSHWLTLLEKNPLPEVLTLHEARQWLWARHNETREGKNPVPFEAIAAKFQWTLPDEG